MLDNNTENMFFKQTSIIVAEKPLKEQAEAGGDS